MTPKELNEINEKQAHNLINSLGGEENIYEITCIKGEWWLTHQDVGSGELLKDWIKDNSVEYLELTKPNKSISVKILEWIVAIYIGLFFWFSIFMLLKFLN